MRARLIGGMPADLVGSLTGLTQGRFPVQPKRATPTIVATRASHAGRSAIFARAGAAGRSRCRTARSSASGYTKRLGRFIQLRDAYGNTYTYGHLRLAVARRSTGRRAASTSRPETEPVAAHPDR